MTMICAAWRVARSSVHATAHNGDFPARGESSCNPDVLVARSIRGKCAVRFAPAWLTEGPGQWEPGAGAHTRTRPAPSAAAHLDPAQPPLTPAHHHRTRPEFLSNNGGSGSSWPATTILTRSSTIVFGIVRKGVMRARAVRVKEPQHVVDAWIPDGRLLGLAPSMSSCGR